MPGHKGKPFLGCEPLDITEIEGADVLCSANGIIAESENNASALFGSEHTFYSTEGSTLCIKAMLAIATAGKEHPTVLAARNAHKAFIHACALLDLQVKWLSPEDSTHLCSCNITPEQIEGALDGSITAVYVTSPDYLGNISDIRGIADVCHAHGVPLLVDNAHGAYLRFLSPSLHPLDLGADVCCDSAHKTLPVLTGGAYLHVKSAEYADRARNALSLFASTSPSYLILQSLDLCNRYLSDGYGQRLAECIGKADSLRAHLYQKGFDVLRTEPLKIVINANASGYTGKALANILRSKKIEAELSDSQYLVLMLTTETRDTDLERLQSAIDNIPQLTPIESTPPALPTPVTATSIRKAMFSEHATVSIETAVGKICATPTVSCPPAVPIAITGERITDGHVAALKYYGVTALEVVKE